MPLKDILVHLDATPRCATRLQLAVALARQHDAHLIGLHVVDTAGAGDGAGGWRRRRCLLGDLHRPAAGAGAGRRRPDRGRVPRDAAARGDPRGMAPGRRRPAQVVALHARYADLAVVGQRDPGQPPPTPAWRSSRCCSPPAGRCWWCPMPAPSRRLGRRVLVGWNASREAARAVADALPILAAAESVTVLAVNPDDRPNPQGEEPGADIALHLARHGVTAKVEHVDRADDPGCRGAAEQGLGAGGGPDRGRRLWPFPAAGDGAGRRHPDAAAADDRAGADVALRGGWRGGAPPRRPVTCPGRGGRARAASPAPRPRPAPSCGSR